MQKARHMPNKLQVLQENHTNIYITLIHDMLVRKNVEENYIRVGCPYRDDKAIGSCLFRNSVVGAFWRLRQRPHGSYWYLFGHRRDNPGSVKIVVLHFSIKPMDFNANLLRETSMFGVKTVFCWPFAPLPLVLGCCWCSQVAIGEWCWSSVWALWLRQILSLEGGITNMGKVE